MPDRATTHRISEFRQQLVRDYHLLWEWEPHILLQKIAHSVSDSVYEHIKSDWIMRSPHEALNSIWKILEDFYSNPRGLIETALLDVKWNKGSLSSNASSLQTYRTKLRNLKSVALSIGKLEELSRPKLVFRIVDCFIADVASRGIRPKQKKEYQLWSQGPSFFRQDSSCWQVGMRYLQPKINQIDVGAEMSASGLKINPIQVEESSFIMHFLSNSASCMEAEKQL